MALPLCLGVALASGAPLLAGIVSGVVGGLVVGYLSQSQTSVSGPATGLAAVVVAAIAELGSFEVFLTAVVAYGCADQHYSTVDAASIERITLQNIENSIADILALSPYLRERIASKEVSVVGAYMDLLTGKVGFGELV